MVAAGVALEAVSVPIRAEFRPGRARSSRSACCCPPSRGARLAVTERALRRGEPLPSNRIALLLAVGVMVVAADAVLGLVTRCPAGFA
jgi:hypothetical protein